jgi:hypothetical protein
MAFLALQVPSTRAARWLPQSGSAREHGPRWMFSSADDGQARSGYSSTPGNQPRPAAELLAIAVTVPFLFREVNQENSGWFPSRKDRSLFFQVGDRGSTRSRW